MGKRAAPERRGTSGRPHHRTRVGEAKGKHLGWEKREDGAISLEVLPDPAENSEARVREAHQLRGSRKPSTACSPISLTRPKAWPPDESRPFRIGGRRCLDTVGCDAAPGRRPSSGYGSAEYASLFRPTALVSIVVKGRRLVGSVAVDIEA